MFDSVDRRRYAAYWYAVGMHDASLFYNEKVGGGVEPDHSEVFSRYASEEAAAYHAGDKCYLPSIPQQWRHFLAGLHAATGTSPDEDEDQ